MDAGLDKVISLDDSMKVCLKAKIVVARSEIIHGKPLNDCKYGH